MSVKQLTKMMYKFQIKHGKYGQLTHTGQVQAKSKQEAELQARSLHKGIGTPIIDIDTWRFSI